MASPFLRFREGCKEKKQRKDDEMGIDETCFRDEGASVMLVCAKLRCRLGWEGRGSREKLMGWGGLFQRGGRFLLCFPDAWVVVGYPLSAEGGASNRDNPARGAAVSGFRDQSPGATK